MPVAQEPRGAALRGNPETQLVIFGQAIRGERIAGRFRSGKRRQGIAADHASHPSERHSGAQGVAHHHCLAMRFRKFLAIMAADPRAMRLRDWQNRELDKVGGIHCGIEQAERCGVDHVLRVMDDDHPSALPAAQFILGQGTVQPIEAVGLGCRPYTVVDHQAQPGIAPRRAV